MSRHQSGRGARTAVSLVAFALAVAAVPAAASAQATFPIGIAVANPLPQARTLEPVSVGFPLGLDQAVTDVNQLILRDAALVQVPCQFKALTRWGADRSVTTAPLKWVLATFRATVPPFVTTSFQVELGGALGGGLTTATSATAITVTPYAGTSFVVPTTSFAPFSGVTLNGQTIVATPGAATMVNTSGTPLAPVVTSPTVVEEAGTIRTVLRQRGTIGGLQYTARWYFHAGRNDVALDFRLENAAAYGLFSSVLADGQVYFDSLTLSQPIAGGTLTVTSTQAAHTLAAGQQYEVAQDFGVAPPYDVLAGFDADLKLNGVQVGSTLRYPGSLDVTGASGGATITLDRFWQNFPKAIGATAGSATVSLFPSWGNGPEYKGIYELPTSTAPVDPLALTNYRFEGGRWKSHHVVFDFHGAGARTPAQVAAEADRVNMPLIGHPDPTHVRKSFATGVLFVERWTPPPYVSVLRATQFSMMMVDDNAATDVPSMGKIGLPKYVNRGGTWGDRQTYGWENFGDLPWADGYCALHYNWPGNMMLEFLRSGDWRYLDRGRDMVAYRRDYGQNHSTATGEWWRGCSFYEKGWWHGNYGEGGHGHNWALGTLLHYVITGDEGSREAALENADFCMRNPPATWTGYWGSRIPGRAIDALVDSYNYLGNPAYLTAAGDGVDRFEQLEVADGMHGYHVNPAQGYTQPWMDNVFYIAAAKYVLASGDGSNLAFLGRMSDWFKAECMFYPQGTVTSVTLPLVFESWSPTTGGGQLSLHLGWSMCEALTYDAVIHSDFESYWTAAVYFEGLTRYWQASTNPFTQYNALNFASYSAITFRPGMFPNSESKTIGMMFTSMNPHIAVRSWYAGYW
jgi:hypothetical protein